MSCIFTYIILSMVRLSTMLSGMTCTLSNHKMTYYKVNRCNVSTVSMTVSKPTCILDRERLRYPFLMRRNLKMAVFTSVKQGDLVIRKVLKCDYQIETYRKDFKILLFIKFYCTI